MARTRSVRIREETSELEKLRQYYSGKPESVRVLFLMLLKDDPGRTILDAARKAGISERRGRYWWDAYRNGGLQKLLDRRVWRKSELQQEGDVVRLQNGEGHAVSDGRSWLTFLNAIAANSAEYNEVRTWVAGFRDALSSLLGDVDFIAMNVRSGLNVLETVVGKAQAYQQYGDDKAVKGSAMGRSGEHKHYYEVVLEKGRSSGFPLDEYQTPPHGYDFFLEEGKREWSPDDETDSLVASIVLLRKKGNPPISQASIDLVERMRPFIVYAVTDFLVRATVGGGKSQDVELLIRKVAGKANLTSQESKVLFLAFLGHSYHEIAENLFVSVNTVQTHIRAIYRKTGVSKLGEVYAKFFTERSFPDEDSSA